MEGPCGSWAGAGRQLGGGGAEAERAWTLLLGAFVSVTCFMSLQCVCYS